MDEELMQLMESLIIKRTEQRDFTSLNQQIKSMRQRFENLKIQHEKEIQEEANAEGNRE